MSLASQQLPKLKPSGFGALDGWHEDDHIAAFYAFLKTAANAQSKPYTTRKLQIDGEALAEISKIALRSHIKTDHDARLFFEKYFQLKVFESDIKAHLTGYYEPVVEASPVATYEFQTPLLSRPNDLVDIDETNRPSDMEEHIRFGRRDKTGKISTYWTRAEIEGNELRPGVLADRGLELCWIKDPIDAYFIHIQGSARLVMTDGSTMRVTYSAKSGHDYTSIGKIMIKQGYLPEGNVNMESLRKWFKENPDLRTSITWQNNSYIFFKAIEIENDDDGPIAAAKTSLVAGRSLAIDRLLHTYGTPVWISLDNKIEELGGSIRRLMIAQDTGSAIVGPSRGDFFVGTGDYAGKIAGAINHTGMMAILVPKPLDQIK